MSTFILAEINITLHTDASDSDVMKGCFNALLLDMVINKQKVCAIYFILFVYVLYKYLRGLFYVRLNFTCEKLLNILTTFLVIKSSVSHNSKYLAVKFGYLRYIQ